MAVRGSGCPVRIVLTARHRGDALQARADRDRALALALLRQHQVTVPASSDALLSVARELAGRQDRRPLSTQEQLALFRLGRQLDGALSSIRMLPEIVHAVGDRVEVHMDGGIRSGQDVLKALALGA